MSATLSHPAAVQKRLEEIDEALADHANDFEQAALEWFKAKRDRERKWADIYVQTDGPSHVRKAEADGATADEGIEAEARYEGKRAVVRMLEARASIGMAILKSQGRVA